MFFALSEGDVFLIVVFLAIPAAVFAIVGVGKVYEQIGKGVFHLDNEVLPQQGPGQEAAIRKDELRQLLEAKSFRAQRRGEPALDVEAELERVLAEVKPSRSKLGDDAALVEEIRQLVVARNERRKRRGEEPLDVESEIERQLRELEGLGQ